MTFWKPVKVKTTFNMMRWILYGTTLLASQTKPLESVVLQNRKITGKTDEESPTTTYFKDNIKNKIEPKMAQVLKFMEANLQIFFKNREWQTIKTYVCNQYK